MVPMQPVESKSEEGEADDGGHPSARLDKALQVQPQRNKERRGSSQGRGNGLKEEACCNPSIHLQSAGRRDKSHSAQQDMRDSGSPFAAMVSHGSHTAPMGIHKLADLIRESAPQAVNATTPKDYEGRIIAIDTSVAIYQFLTAMPDIYNRNGQNISLLQGLFYRTVNLLENGIKPVYVFDGHPPDLKQPLLARRAETSGVSRRTAGAGQESLPGSERAVEKDCETLLRHLGVPCIQAPSEAEATCAALVMSGKVWCTATEDMDALPFGSTYLIRHLTAVKKCEVEEFSLPVILEKLKLTHRQFVDLCILLGCDYSGKIRGLGPKKALKLLHAHGSIERILQHIDPQKHPIPDNWHYKEARKLFLEPKVVDASRVELEWTEPDEEQLVQFLSHQKHMNEVRVRNRMEKLRTAQSKKRAAQQQQQEASPEKKQRTLGEFFPVKKSAVQRKVAKPQRADRRQNIAKAECSSPSTHHVGT